MAQGALAAGAAYVAVMLVAYERLGSAWAASLILLAELLPGMLFGPLIGAWLDRHDRLRAVIASDVVRAAALAAMIVAPGAVPMFALAAVVGVAGTFFRPAAFALLPAAVHEDRRMAATAAWGALHDAGLMIGPALAAGVLVLGGAPLLLGCTALLFAGSALLFSRVRLVAAPERDETDASLVDGAREGLRFVGRDRVLRVLVAGTGVIVLAAGMMNVAEVVLAERDLRVGGAGFAAMVAVFGVGAVLGSLASARSETLAQLKLGYVGGLGVLAAGLLALRARAVARLGARLVLRHGLRQRGVHDARPRPAPAPRPAAHALPRPRAGRHDRGLGLRRRGAARRHARDAARRPRRVRRRRPRTADRDRRRRPQPAAPGARRYAQEVPHAVHAPLTNCMREVATRTSVVTAGQPHDGPWRV